MRSISFHFENCYNSNSFESYKAKAMKAWHWLKDYFDLNRNERRGVALLVCLILFLIVFIYLIPYIFPAKQEDFNQIRKLSQSIDRQKDSANDENVNTSSLPDMEKRKSEVKPVLFAFNPNSASKADFVALGLSEKTAGTIIRYREKGGHFYNKEDLMKVYGMNEQTFHRLEPYILTEERKTESKTFAQHPQSTTKEIINIELNSADSEGLVKIRGIGPSFASRILKYRKLLGGFLSKEQLYEVYGLDSAKYIQIESQVNVNPALCTKLHINTLSLDELKHHPYLKYKSATAIIRYREQHGAYHSLEDLKKVRLLDEAIILKIQPYISFE